VFLFSTFYKIKVFLGDYKIKVDFYQCFKGILFEQCVADVSTCAILSKPDNALHLYFTLYKRNSTSFEDNLFTSNYILKQICL